MVLYPFSGLPLSLYPSIPFLFFTITIDSRFITRTLSEKESEREWTRATPRRYSFRDYDRNRDAIFVFRIKSQVIMGSGDRVRARGIEGQVMREREREERGKGWRMGRGCCAGCSVSKLVQHCTKRLMMHLGILVEPIERRRVLAERLTLALRPVHSYSAEFNLICWSRRNWYDTISMFIWIDILRVSFEDWNF